MAPRGRASQRGADAADLNWRWRTAASSREEKWLEVESWRPVAGSRIRGGLTLVAAEKDGITSKLKTPGLRFKGEERETERETGGKVGHLIILSRNLLGKILLCHEVIYYGQYTDDRAVRLFTLDSSQLSRPLAVWKNHPCMYITEQRVLKTGAGSSRAPPPCFLQGGTVW